ncbi:MAG TPA: type I methionyl aminopeptidase [Candidatus Saccharimonadales bacterium]|nr:type I methionyl aminopeptidase [Candidatus Saccharimonadales bacterium]
MKTRIKTAHEIAAMRESGRMLGAVLTVVSKHVAPGISTKELANIAASELKSLGGKPAFLGHQGFPDVICISINDEIVHGIPSPQRILADGDLVGLDFGVSYKGMLTDSAMSVIVGTPKKPEHKKLLEITERALEAGIAAVHDMVRVGDIGAAIEAVLKPGKYGIPRDLVGHGIGQNLWEEPNIPNYGRPNTGPWLSAGMTIAIEPMVTLGTHQIVGDDDGWTIHTADGSWSAHFEHTVLILDDGAEILTKREK